MRTAALFALALTLVLALPSFAQDDPGQRIQRLMSEAIDHLTAGTEAMKKARALQGEEAEKLKAQASASYDQGVARYDQILELLQGVEGNEAMIEEIRALCYYNTACARSMQGRIDDALTAFGRSLEHGFADFDHIAQDSDLDPIRNEPRFLQLIERARAAAGQEMEEAAGEALSKDAMFPYDFTVTSLDGAQVALSSLRGKVVVVHFWSMAEARTRQMIPDLVQLGQAMGDKVAIVGMAWEKGQAGDAVAAKVRAFARDAGVKFPLALLADRAELEKIPEFKGFPTTLMIDKQGRVRAVEVNYRDVTALRALAQALDAEGAPAPAPTPTPPGGGSVGPF